MDKKRALIILIKNSYFLPEKSKKSLLPKVEKMSGKQVQELGSYLAFEYQFIQKNKDKILGNIKKML